MRAMHAVVDAALFLLLVGAAVGTLSLPAERLQPGTADAATTTLTTSTAEIDYTLAPGARHANETLVPFPSTEGPEFERTAHGTLAELLATAATNGVTIDGREVTHTGDDLDREVRGEVRNATRGGRRVAVRAVWEPYPDAPVAGRVRVGPQPPPDTDVWASRTTVDSGFPTVRERATVAATTDGYAGVARVVANAVVRGLFPPDVTRLALHGDYPLDALVAYRYRRVATLTGADVAGPVAAGEPERANERLAAALAPRLEADLRASFESPRAAASAVRVGEVRITVRVWSP